MRYTNQICEVCGNIFTSDDDIVVCPECATPHHRECYKNNGGCINAHKHGTDFSWEPLGEKSEIATHNDTPAKTVPCPNCGYNNPEGSDHCKQCSMKFTLFGFNVVDAQAKLEEEEAQKNTSSIPEYEAPFELGTGEGFEENGEEKFTPPTARDEVEQKLIDVISSSSGFSPDGEDFSFGGPFPKEDKTCGVHTNLMGAFIGSGAMKYIEKFKRAELRKKPSFNFAAFFFSPYWFFYRKLIKPGIIFMTVNICLSVISTPFAIEFMEKAMPLMERLAEVTTDGAAADILIELESLYVPVMTFTAIQFVINLIAGFVANPLYRKYTSTNLKEIENMTDRKNCMAHLLKKGGVAPLYALIALLGENLLSSIAGMLMQ